MSPSQKSLSSRAFQPSRLQPSRLPSSRYQPSRIPAYFAACRNGKRNHSRNSTPPPRSLSEDLEAQQEIDLRAEDLKPAKLRRLQQELNLYNATGHIVTFDKVLNDWVTWDRFVLPPLNHLIYTAFI